MMRINFTLILLFVQAFVAFGQEDTMSVQASSTTEVVKVTEAPQPMKLGEYKFVQPKSGDSKWSTTVYNIHAPKEYSQEVESIKKEKNAIKDFAQVNIGIDQGNNRRAFEPKIGVNFEGNELKGVSPPDNTVAISRDGFVVSVDNATIEYYKEDGSVLLSRESHTDFFNDVTLNSKIFDPRILFDPVDNRFIYVILHGSTPSTSRILVAFSKSTDPRDGWNVYKVKTSDLMGSSSMWFDFPVIGVSKTEFFITGNMFDATNKYKQSIIMQIEKSNGITGSGSLNMQVWKDVKTSLGTNAFTMVPVSYGQDGSYGPEMFFVSNSGNGSKTNGNIYMYSLSGPMSSSNETLSTYTLKIPGGYSLAGDAKQKGTSELLHTGNCKVASAFYLDGIVHFVFTSEYLTGFAGVNYCRVDVTSKNIKSRKFGLTGFDYTYPTLASFSANSTDYTVVIGVLRTGTSIFPESRILTYDHEMNPSNSVLFKSGETFVSIISGRERWGDYTGMARKYGSTEPEVWMAACYGVSDRNKNGYNTWVGQINPAFGVGIREDLKEKKALYVAPNPVKEMFELNFIVQTSGLVKIDLVTVDGRLVRELYKDKLKMGENTLSFNKGVLSPGVYFLKIHQGQDVLSHKIILD